MKGGYKEGGLHRDTGREGEGGRKGSSEGERVRGKEGG